MIDAAAAAGMLQAMHRALAVWRADGAEVAEIGGAVATVVPGEMAKFPSASVSRVFALDAVSSTPEVVERAMEFLEKRGAGRWFLWLGPKAEGGVREEWLAARGFARWTWTEYPALFRKSSPGEALAPFPDQRACPFEVRRVTAAEVAGLGADMAAIDEGTMRPGFFARTAGRPGFDHLAAFDGGRAVAVGAMFSPGGCAYLCAAATNPAFRGRGAQGALIRARVALAAERGCAWCASETLTMLETSLRNLGRGGFERVFDERVYLREEGRAAGAG